MRAKKVYERKELDDPYVDKALQTWRQAFSQGELEEESEFKMEVKKPFSITIEEKDLAKFKFLFNKYRVPYDFKEL